MWGWRSLVVKTIGCYSRGSRFGSQHAPGCVVTYHLTPPVSMGTCFQGHEHVHITKNNKMNSLHYVNVFLRISPYIFVNVFAL